MLEFITQNLLTIVFGLISAGALAFCKYLHTQIKNYKKLVDERENTQLEETIVSYVEPIKQEIGVLKEQIKATGALEQTHMDLIVSSYRFRLIQLCRDFIHQGYLTQKQYDQLTEFYKLYTGLGGNGQAHDYYETAIKLPIHD